MGRLDRALRIFALRLKECGKVSSHRSIASNGKPIRGSRKSLARRPVGYLAAREKTVDQQLAYAAAIDLDRHCAANQFSSPAQHGDAVFFRAVGHEQGFFGRPARVPQSHRLPGIELHALFGKKPGHIMGQGQIHVVAAHQQMIADGNALQDQFALFFGDAD